MSIAARCWLLHGSDEGSKVTSGGAFAWMLLTPPGAQLVPPFDRCPLKLEPLKAPGVTRHIHVIISNTSSVSETK